MYGIDSWNVILICYLLFLFLLSSLAVNCRRRVMLETSWIRCLHWTACSMILYGIVYHLLVSSIWLSFCSWEFANIQSFNDWFIRYDLEPVNVSLNSRYIVVFNREVRNGFVNFGSASVLIKTTGLVRFQFNFVKTCSVRFCFADYIKSIFCEYVVLTTNSAFCIVVLYSSFLIVIC